MTGPSASTTRGSFRWTDATLGGTGSHWLPTSPHRIALSAMKPQNKLTRTQRRLQRRLARYDDLTSPTLARFREVRDHTLLDIRATRELMRAGEVLRIALVDHVIVGRPSPDHASLWVSLRALGYFA